MKPSEALNIHRDKICEMVLGHGMSNPRVFGSVLHGIDTEDSDLDLAIDRGPETSLLDIIVLERHLSELLGVRVDVFVPTRDPGRIAKLILAEAKPI